MFTTGRRHSARRGRYSTNCAQGGQEHLDPGPSLSYHVTTLLLSCFIKCLVLESTKVSRTFRVSICRVFCCPPTRSALWARGSLASFTRSIILLWYGAAFDMLHHIRRTEHQAKIVTTRTYSYFHNARHLTTRTCVTAQASSCDLQGSRLAVLESEAYYVLG